MYKVGTEFWRAETCNGSIQTECVTVTKVTKVWYFIEPSMIMFGCATRLRKLSWDRRNEARFNTTMKAALMKDLRGWKAAKKEAEKNIKALRKELGL